MATWFRREVTTRRVEWVVPARAPFGADWAQVLQAFNQAERELRAAGWIPEGQEPSDDLIRFDAGDEEIVIYYEAAKSFAALEQRAVKAVERVEGVLQMFQHRGAGGVNEPYTDVYREVAGLLAAALRGDA